MGRFVSAGDTKTVRATWWDEDEEVVIKRFSYGDRQRLAGEATRVGLVGEAGEGPREFATDVQVERINLSILELGIVRWTLKGEGGKVVPLNRKWIYRLKEEDAEFLLGEINALNPRRSAEA